MKIQSTFNPVTEETLVWGCKIGEPSYKEEILYRCKGYVNTDKLMKKCHQWAKDNRYDRLRFSKIDLSKPPKFEETINERIMQ